jgi:hypothetical protein
LSGSTTIVAKYFFEPQSLVFDIGLFGFRGEALSVYLAQPAGLGMHCEKNNGPTDRRFEFQTVGPLAHYLFMLHNPARWAGLGKLLDLRPEIPETAELQN